jgi:hypothetical protein
VTATNRYRSALYVCVIGSLWTLVRGGCSGPEAQAEARGQRHTARNRQSRTSYLFKTEGCETHETDRWDETLG